MSQSQWITLIEDTAYGRVTWNSHADVSPWEGFYRDYREASVPCRQEIDDAFLYSLDSIDPRVMDEAIRHAHHLPVQVAVTRLLQLLEQRNAFLLAHKYRDSDQSLLACVLNTLASCAESCSIEPPLQLQARNSILHWVPKAGRLSSVVGTFFGGMGPEAVDALAAVLPNKIYSTPPLMDAGYELHRSPERWKRIMELADQWPPPLREALQRGGANHAARFPQTCPETP